MKLEPGYYWIKTDWWRIAEWNGRDWYECGNDYPTRDKVVRTFRVIKPLEVQEDETKHG